MRSCLVLGTGRSGTSLVTGLLADAGYDVGGQAWRARAANPHGFFETPEINGLNEELLAPLMPPQPELIDGQRWLGIPARAISESVSPEIAERMSRAVAQRPFGLKDPRFSFTLPAWRPRLGDAAFVAVFRHPAATAVSMLEEVRRAAYLDGVGLDLAHVFQLWIATYRDILENHAGSGDWLFLHYDQALSRDGHERLGRFLGAPIDGRFADPKLRRPAPDVEVPEEAMELYRELCARAGYTPDAAPEAPERAVSVVAVIADGDEAHVANVVDDARAQRGVRTELVLVDATRGGLADPPTDVTLVRAATPSRGAAWLRGIDAAQHDCIALQLPGCRSMPSRLAHAVAALDAGGHDLVTCDYWLEDDEGQFVGRSNPSLMGGAPGPFWESGVVAERNVLEAMRETAFFPVELELLRRLSAAERVGHVLEPGFGVARSTYSERWERARDDATLVTLSTEPASDGAPALTVSLCTYDRPEVFLESLEAFCRQSVPPGTFELVVVDDGDPARTQATLQSLELPIPCTYLRGPAAGLAAARNTGLAHSRGRYVLFVNDDTIPFFGLVEEHLRTHARLPRPACVQGTFEQPAEAQRNALLRYLERSGEVFGFADMRPGEWHDPFHFYTCNVSVPLEEVRAVGGFDPSFRFYGCEDTDLGARLAKRGCEVFYTDRARAWHRHPMDLAYIEQRQQTVARAYVHFFRKHPDLLAAWKSEKLDAEWIAKELDGSREECQRGLAALRELAGVDVGALDNLQGEWAETGQAILAAVEEWMPKVNRAWWRSGYLQGFAEHGLSGFEELTRRGTTPWGIATQARRRVLAFPNWEDGAALERLFRRAAPLAGDSDTALVLRLAPTDEVAREEGLERLSAAYETCFPNGEALEVVLEEAELDAVDLHRLGCAVDAVLVTGDEDPEVLARTIAERLPDAEHVEHWLARFGTPEPSPELDIAAARSRPAPFEPALELSVIVPTHERHRELAQLLERLAQQDLDPERFEVIVVDDGSRDPAAQHVQTRADGAGPWPFELSLLRQSPSGPAAARNLALREARGDLIVFLNDDAVPARDTLRRHLEAHRRAAGPIAALGTFRLLRRHLNTSFGHHVETSTALFGQPAMQPGVLYDGLSLSTGNLSVPRAALIQVGGFDEVFPWAGGEDSELGLRLEHELGIRVLFDPAIRCEHDHALDVVGFERRRRVVGWAAWRIFALHGDARVLGAGARPADPDWWLDLSRNTADDAGRLHGLLNELTALADGERDGGVDAQTLAAVRPAYESIGEHAFYAGLLAAKEGRGPLDPDPAPALPSSRTPSTSKPDASNTSPGTTALSVDGTAR